MKYNTSNNNNSPLQFQMEINNKIANGEKIISLGLGIPSINPSKELIESVSQQMYLGYNKYINVMGDIKLRNNLVGKLKSYNSILTKSENVAITFGAKQAILISLQTLLEPDDEVIYFEPSYVSYAHQVLMAEPEAIIKKINLDKNDFKIDFGELEKNINHKTKAILINYPHNPTGSVLSNQDVNKLTSLMERFPNCYIISDEVYEYYIYRNHAHFSIGSIKALENRVFTISGFGKTYGITGWRVGYMVIPDRYVDKAKSILLHTNSNVTSFVQKGLNYVFDNDEDLISPYIQRFEKASQFLFDQLIDTKVKLQLVNGGMFSFIDISNTEMSSDLFAAELLRLKDTAVNPGIIFGEDWNNFIRVSFCGEKEETKKGIMNIKEFVNGL